MNLSTISLALTRLGWMFSPAALFAAGEQGVWYDPSDLTTLFQDSAGTTPVTAVQQPVGLMLDKSKGLVLGPELVVNGDFSNGLTGWSSGGTGVSSAAGELLFTASANQSGIFKLNQYTIGKYYQVVFEIKSISSGGVYLGVGGTFGTNRTTVGVFTERLLCQGDNILRLYCNGVTTASIDNVSVKEVLGNHAFQTTSASRPVLSARYNLLTKTEQFDDAAWNKSGGAMTITPAILDPDGTTTAVTLTNTALVAQDFFQTIPALSGTGSATIFVRRRTGSGLVQGWSGSAYSSYAPQPTADWQKLSVTTASGGIYFLMRLAAGDAVDIWHPDLRVSNDALGQPAYQRVNTATDYDTVGFKPYLVFDGVDDSLVTNSIDFTATDKMTVFAGARKLSDAAAGILAELSSIASNAGAFGLQAPNSAVNSYRVESAGTILQSASVTGFAAPLTNVLTGLLNISGDSVTARVNGTQAANNTGDQGTGNYGNYPLFIGRRNNASLPFNGRLYSLIVRGAASTTAQITSTETYVTGKTGVTLPVATFDFITTDTGDQIVTDDGDSVITDTYFA